MSSQYAAFLNLTNKFFTVIFTVEILMKLAVKQADFFKDGLNVFDMIIVIIGVVEIGMSLSKSSEGTR